MGKKQIINTKNSESQGQGICEKIFKVVNINPTFRSFRRISPQSPNFTKAKVDHHRNYSAKSTISKPVAIADQYGSTFPLQLNHQQIPSQDKYHNLSSASSMVPVEYNHSAGESCIPKFKGESLKAVNKYYNHQNQDPYKGDEPHVKKSPVKNMFTIVHHEINEGGHKDDNDMFSNYIDHVKNKMRNISSFDDDNKVSHYSKFKIN